MSGKLIFNSGSIIWSHIFSLSKPIELDSLKKPEFQKDEAAANLDKELFENYDTARGDLLRYRLPGFHVKIRLNSNKEDCTDTVLYGYVHVRAAIYFKSTVCISYRMLLDRRRKTALGEQTFKEIKDQCYANQPLSIDDLIVIAGAPVGSEHWQSNDKAEVKYRVTGNITFIEAKIEEIPGKGETVINSDELMPKSNAYTKENESSEENPAAGKAVNQLLKYYRNLLIDDKQTALQGTAYTSFYSLVDVWEDVEHTENPKFSALSEKEIITHIQADHKKELLGLLTLYPVEWMYRRSDLFDLVCGPNIGLDNDDLVLLSGSVCLVIGTYGRRDMVLEGVQWGSVLSKTRRDFHMSYQEYYFILDLIMAKRHAIRSAAIKTTDCLDSFYADAQQNENIQKLSETFIETSRSVMEIDRLKNSRFEALRIQAAMTEQRLCIDQEYKAVTELLTHLDDAIKTIDNINEQKRKKHLSQLLIFISLAAILSLIFDDPQFAILRDLLRFLKSNGILSLPLSEQTWASIIAELVITIIMVIVFVIIGNHILTVFSGRNKKMEACLHGFKNKKDKSS